MLICFSNLYSYSKISKTYKKLNNKRFYTFFYYLKHMKIYDIYETTKLPSKLI